MAMDKHIILGVHIGDRFQKASDVQTVLTEYGCNIKTRLGLHEVSPDYCSPAGILILEVVGDEARCLELAGKLGTIEGIEVQKMIFDHE